VTGNAHHAPLGGTRGPGNNRPVSTSIASSFLNAWSLAMGLTSDTAQPRWIGVLASRLVLSLDPPVNSGRSFPA